jgi:hypothetical protein
MAMAMALALAMAMAMALAMAMAMALAMAVALALVLAMAVALAMAMALALADALAEHTDKEPGISKRMDFKYMRKEHDFRSDQAVKKEIYQRDIEPLYEIIFCVDDRQRVVDAWRDLGLICLQCAPGNH